MQSPNREKVAEEGFGQVYQPRSKPVADCRLYLDGGL